MTDRKQRLAALAGECMSMPRGARHDDVRALDDAIYTTTTGKEPINCATSPNYHSSQDAAFWLAPEGWYLRVEPRFYSDDNDVRWRAYAIKPDWSKWSPHDDWFEVIGEDDKILAATPALALAAAALLARAQSETVA